MSKGYAVGPRQYATGLRNYVPNPSGTPVGPQPAGAMAPHLSQPIPLDQDLISAYKEIMDNKQAQQYNQTGMDIEKVWRTSPNASVFKPGYEHNPYVQARADELRALRTAPKVEPQYIQDPETGEMIPNPAYVNPRPEQDSD